MPWNFCLSSCFYSNNFDFLRDSSPCHRHSLLTCISPSLANNCSKSWTRRILKIYNNVCKIPFCVPSTLLMQPQRRPHYPNFPLACVYVSVNKSLSFYFRCSTFSCLKFFLLRIIITSVTITTRNDNEQSFWAPENFSPQLSFSQENQETWKSPNEKIPMLLHIMYV